ncbi:hypothetical protein PY257_04595 [Ramlibacter sp. H39-3-26]|uniref:hypothetical protein n=1 Tax=Curvibacter soli TaxID=3031331 RepID=UPI0023DA3E24|nr:hypothetical protein [Ramlibacter sp. H39-3-26]MDF1484464.1 hypothetical protein [Ramlibacter sp. H39-3-26]
MLSLSSPTSSRLSSLLPEDLGEELKALQQDPAVASGLQLLAALARADESGGPLPERLPRLRAHLDAALELAPRLRARADDAQLSSPRQARWTLRLAQQMLQAAHQGFKRAAVDGSAAKGLFARHRPTIEAFALAMWSGWQLAVLHARAYTALPPGFWSDCHRLFVYAAGQGWDDKAPGADVPTPLGESYRRILLLGMTGSNRYEADQLGMLIELIEESAPQLGVGWLGPRTAPQGAFVCQEHSDRPPLFTAPLPHAGGEHPYLAVDTRRVEAELQRRIDAQQNAAVSSPRRLQLYQRLQQEWTRPAQRRHTRRRRAGDDRVELISALAACWAVVDSERAHAGAWAQRFAPEPRDAPAAESASPAELPTRAAMLSVANISHSGLLLQGDPGSQPLGAGEVAVYRRPGRSWRLGLIRWVNFRLESMLTQCGIEYLGGSLEAVMVAPVTAGSLGDYQQALRINGRNVIVVEGRYFHPFREFLMGDAQALVRIRAVRLVLQSIQYQAMEYQVVGPAEG